MGLAGAGSADQHGIALLAIKSPPASSLTSVWLIGVPSNWKSSRSLIAFTAAPTAACARGPFAGIDVSDIIAAG
jgi:hypothetical protein